MKRFAFDIAIIPPENIMKICIGLNNKENSLPYQHLNSKNNLPHITLAMGITTKNNAEEIRNELETFLKDTGPLELKIIGMDHDHTPEGKRNRHFVIKKTPELQKLHEEIMKIVSKHATYDGTIEDIYTDEGEAPIGYTLEWLNNYGRRIENSNLFRAHISLKCMNAEYKKLPLKFSADRIAFCYLGNYCTCRKIIWEKRLKG